ncbi:T-cell receptor beta chain V region E1 [Platysternon megacephalum]|nr:T-cell receptor beta chain V region E1 [Platysternon megacephalum]
MTLAENILHSAIHPKGFPLHSVSLIHASRILPLSHSQTQSSPSVGCMLCYFVIIFTHPELSVEFRLQNTGCLWSTASHCNIKTTHYTVLECSRGDAIVNPKNAGLFQNRSQRHAQEKVCASSHLAVLSQQHLED